MRSCLPLRTWTLSLIPNVWDEAQARDCRNQSLSCDIFEETGEYSGFSQAPKLGMGRENGEDRTP